MEAIHTRIALAVAVFCLGAALAGCGAQSHRAQTAVTAPAPAGAASDATASHEAATGAEIARERAAASEERPPAAVVAAAGATPAARNAPARAELLRAARALEAYGRKHGTYAIGTVARLHRVIRGTALIDFFDGRQSDFFLAVDPPTTTTIWRFNFDHDKGRTACGPGGSGCPPGRRW